ncbi:MAG: hypothetical protein JW731_14320 [Bacteroidales bacterium]|nr:hypothetical protein [Bacteroidales bacterium]
MEKSIFWKDEYSLNELTGKLEKVKMILQAIVSKFSDMGIQITDIQQLAGLVDNRRHLIDGMLENFVFNQLFPKAPAGIKRDIYRNMVELPDLSAIKESFEPLEGYFGGLNIPDIVNWNAYSIRDGKVEIIEAEKENLQSRFYEVAETKAEQDRLEAVRELCNSLNKLVTFAADHPANYIVKGVVEFDENTGKFVPGRHFVKNGGVTFNWIIGSNKKAESLKTSPVANEPAKIAADASDADRGTEFAKSRNL